MESKGHWNRRDFPETRHSLIEAVQGDNEAAARAAFIQLVEDYYPAIRSFLYVTLRLEKEFAEDILQGFLADKLVAKKILTQFDPEKSKRFRHWLKKAIENYLISQRRRGKAQKRNPPGPIFDIDDHRDALRDQADLYEVQWAYETVRLALEAMRQRCEKEEETLVWRVFVDVVLDEALGKEVTRDCAQLAAGFGISVDQLGRAKMKGTRMYLNALTEEVGRYTPKERIDQDLKELHELLLASPGWVERSRSAW